MSDAYNIHCDCGAVKMTLKGDPIVRGNCHCQDCRTLLDIPYHSVTAWEESNAIITEGAELVREYQHPTLSMKRATCTGCGEVMYNTNAKGWRVVSQHLIRKCHNNELPEELSSRSHFFYASRIVTIDDDLPKRD